MCNVENNVAIANIVDDIFKDIPYSDKIIVAKKRIADCLEKEYLKELDINNETQAVGLLMYKYGTLMSAGKLAGFSDEEILSWQLDENVIDEKNFKKLFDRQKLFSYMVSAILIVMFLFINNVILYRDIVSVVGVCFSFIILLIMLTTAKKKGVDVLEHDKLNTQAYKHYNLLLDRYHKRLLNTIFVTCLYFEYILLTIVVAITKMQMTFDETIIMIVTNSLIGIFGLALISKNIIISKWLDGFFESAIVSEFKKHKWRIVIVSLIYSIITVLFMVMMRKSNMVFFTWYRLSLLIYGCLCVCYNLLFRKKVVRKNIVINIKRGIALSLVMVIIITVNYMQLDHWILQPYISTIPSMEYRADTIEYNEKTGVYSITTDKNDFKILQLTDIHLGGSTISTEKDYKALDAVYKLIENTKPDFIVVTGDLVFPMGIFSYSLNNTTPIMQFCMFMRNIGIPWSFIYGNHDTEDMATGSPEDVENLFMSLSFKMSHSLLYPYIQPQITGRNNQMIEIKNSDGSLRQALFLLDSNDYTGDGLNDYDFIHDDQVDWYKAEIIKLQKQYGENVSSLMFFHMPLQEYKTAYELYEAGSDEVTYFFGENGEKMIDKICCSKYHSKIFDTAVELGSTKAMFCGHDHYNNTSFEYKGIRLTYGLSIDYLAMPGIDKDVNQRGATLISLDGESKFSIKQIKLTEIE